MVIEEEVIEEEGVLEEVVEEIVEVVEEEDLEVDQWAEDLKFLSSHTELKVSL